MCDLPSAWGNLLSGQTSSSSLALSGSQDLEKMEKVRPWPWGTGGLVSTNVNLCKVDTGLESRLRPTRGIRRL